MSNDILFGRKTEILAVSIEFESLGEYLTIIKGSLSRISAYKKETGMSLDTPGKKIKKVFIIFNDKKKSESYLTTVSDMNI